MRCLYCGKELALLKRLRGGGEFCSDAHRQQYQEEYNQLALSRLLQAKPAEEAKDIGNDTPASSGAGESLPSPASNWTAQAVEPEHVPVPVAAVEPERAPVANGSGSAVKDPAPMSGFLVDLPSPTEPPPFQCIVDLQLLESTATVLPVNGAVGELPVSEAPGLAGRVPLPAAKASDAPLAPKARNVEPREFGRPAPRLESSLAPARSFVLDAASQPLKMSMTLSEPPKAVEWIAPEQSFVAPETELGPLARMSFRTVRLGSDVSEDVAPAPSMDSAALELSEPVVEQVADAVVEPAAEAPAVKTEELAPAKANEESPAKAAEALQTEPEVPPQVQAEGEPAREAEVAVPPPMPPQPVPQVAKEEKEPEAKIPGAVAEPLFIAVDAVTPGRARPIQVFASPLSASADLQIPRTGATPLRAVMVLGPTPVAEKAPVEKPVERAVEKAAEAPKKIEEQPLPARSKKSEERSTPAKSPGEEKPLVAVKPPVEKLKLPPRIKPEQDRRQIKPAEPKPIESKPPALSVPQPELAKEKEKEKEKPAALPVPAPEPERMVAKANVTPAPAPAPPVPAPEPEIDLDLPVLHMGAPASFWERLPVVAKLAVAAMIVAAVSGVAYMMLGSGTASAVPTVAKRETIVPSAPITDASWIENWSADAAKKGRLINLLKSSLPLSDYRLQFEAQIESKALGWVYRATDPQNYYVAKLEVIRPGLDPVVALVRYAVIKGQDQPRTTKPLKQKVRVDTLYKVRFDAVGNQFTAWVGDEKVEDWTDDRLHTGAPGLLSEKGESSVMRGNLNVIPLTVRKQ